MTDIVERLLVAARDETQSNGTLLQEPGAIAQYLSLHGVDAEVIEVPQTSMRVSEHILMEADNLDADLLVMGAFSHSRLREFVLGGVTQDILRFAPSLDGALGGAR